MAHVKVTRRSMRPEEYIDLRCGWLKRLAAENMHEVSPVMVRNALQTGDNSFLFYEDEPFELKRGDLCYTPDGSLFFEARAALPAALAGQQVWLYMKTTSEVVVKVNGRYAGGFDPNRQLTEITPFLDGPDVHIEMLGYNRSKPDDERNPETLALRGCRQVFEGLWFCTVNGDVTELCYDLALFTDIIGADCFDEDYRAFVKIHVAAALDMIDFERFDVADVRRARQYLDRTVYADATYRGSGRVALVAHSHLDLAYYWRRLHTVQKNLRTVLIQMRLMDRHPGFTYCHTQPYVYETLQKHYPDVFEELKEKVARGQFEPVGAMYVEPDCNLPNAESLIRQCLYGQQFYLRNFGFTVSNCWLPDVFGNSWILPQILKKSGVDYFVSNKMSTWNDTNRFPHNHFIWRGIDGTDVYACVPPTHFIGWNAPSQIARNWSAFQDKQTGTETLCMFGYGDGGSGVTEEMLALMERVGRLSAMPQVRHVRADDFLRQNFTPDRKFDVWDGELYLEMHRGTFTTKAALKRKNRVLEEKLRTAELMCVLRGEDRQAELTGCCKQVLVQQFHDILPGSHIAPVFKDAMEELSAAETRLDAIIGGGDVLFNTLNFARAGVEFIAGASGHFVRYGQPGEFCRVTAGPLAAAAVEPPAADDGWCTVTESRVVTPFYELTFAPDGSITSLFDRELGREWVRGGFNRLCLYDDKPGMYDAWDILPQYIENERPLLPETPVYLCAVTGECAEFAAVQKTERSRFERRIRLFRSDRAIEVEVLADWHESHKLLKCDFGVNVLTRELVCDTSAGFIRRPTHKNTSWEAARFECCTHKWFDMAETGGGVAVLNDGKYGVGILGDTVSLSLLRATERPDPQADLGAHDFCYRILPHAGSHTEAGVNRAALAFNAPLVPAAPVEEPALLKSFGELYLQCVKRAEDGKKTVCRLIETDGRRGTIRLPKEVVVTDLLERTLYKTDTLSYRPFEILTVAF